MHVAKEFVVDSPRDDVVQALGEDETLIGLFPESETEIVESSADRKTTRTHYRALGREGTATFHFDFLMDGNVRFEKVCDGNVWRHLSGEVTFEEAGAGTQVRIEMEGKTKAFVPEFTIKGPMQDQVEQMANALQQRLGRS